jgi:uncharacterized protein (UPF0332 family)
MALYAKAVVALRSAKLLLSSGDIDGACNRAYYAMADAARASLWLLQPETDASVIKTHSGLISAFSLQLVKGGRVPSELGRMFNRAEEIRLVADYKSESIGQEIAAQLIRDAETFVGAMHAFASN